MNFRRLIVPFVVAAAWMATFSPASAHRLDECLEATRLAVSMDRVGLEIDITPGAAVASDVFAAIDTNRDGRISGAEQESFARQVLRFMALSVDGRAVPATLVSFHFPDFREMRGGTGIIALRATAKIRKVGAGHHQVSFVNTHRFKSSVYLVNALAPENPRIQLGDRQRDSAQHGLTLDYDVAADPPSARIFVLFVALVLAARWFLRRRIRGKTRPSAAQPHPAAAPENV